MQYIVKQNNVSPGQWCYIQHNAIVYVPARQQHDFHLHTNNPQMKASVYSPAAEGIQTETVSEVSNSE